MDSKLLDILACPKCKQALSRGKGGNYLICEAEGLAYPIVEGIPYLLESKAIAIADIGTADMASNA
jgi:uncharacterized protein